MPYGIHGCSWTVSIPWPCTASRYGLSFTLNLLLIYYTLRLPEPKPPLSEDNVIHNTHNGHNTHIIESTALLLMGWALVLQHVYMYLVYIGVGVVLLIFGTW